MNKNESFGYLEYDPKSETTRFDPWWLILRCDIGLVRLYQHLIGKEGTYLNSSSEVFGVGNWPVIRRGIKLKKSVWGAHISIVRGEEPKDKKLWKKYSNRKIYFEYTPFAESNNFHWWLPVYSQSFHDIREELGLPIKARAPFHLTVGSDAFAFPSQRK